MSLFFFLPLAPVHCCWWTDNIKLRDATGKIHVAFQWLSYVLWGALGANRELLLSPRTCIGMFNALLALFIMIGQALGDKDLPVHAHGQLIQNICLTLCFLEFFVPAVYMLISYIACLQYTWLYLKKRTVTHLLEKLDLFYQNHH